MKINIAMWALLIGFSSALLSLFPASGAVCQANATSDHFDVASIRETSPDFAGTAINPSANNYRARGVTLKFLIQEAYDLHEFQVMGSPAWAEAQRFDVAAKADADPSAKQEDSMLRRRLISLLADRFHLRVHLETREQSVLELAVVGRQSKMNRGASDSGYSIGPGRLKCSDSSMSTLASILSDYLDAIVLDRTGLVGGYQFSLVWKPSLRSAPDDDRPELPTALQEQLGLKLNKSKGPVQVLVVDHAERPSGN